MSRRSPRRRTFLAPLVAALVLAIVPNAQAGPLVSSATSCSAQTLEQPFVPWLDPAQYVLAPDGTFEAGANAWSLSGAYVASGNEPYYVHGSSESKSLRLPTGSSATSPSMCVGLEHPTLRFFARAGRLSLSTLHVDVLFEDAFGGVHSLPVGEVASGSSWQPTPAMAVVANLLPLLPGERTAVAFRFTVQGTGGWRIDDVYVDPICR